MKLLHLNLKGEYFDAIKSGEKSEEYRLFNTYWKKRLIGKTYDLISIRRGYPKRDDSQKFILRDWQGYRVTTIKHPHFGKKPVKVFAIRVNP